MQRRDFLNGLALVIGAPPALGTVAPLQIAAPASGPSSGAFAGQDDAAMRHGHRLGGPPRDWFESAAERDPAVEDLVVVGTGLSGLAGAVTFVRHADRAVRVLMLDAQAAPGGHAQRNEFVSRSGRRLIGYGGSQALDSPGLFSPAVHALLRDVGIDLRRFERDAYDDDWRARHGLGGSAVYFDGRAWPEDRVVWRRSGESLAEWLGRAPMTPAARASLVALAEPLPREQWPARSAPGVATALAGMTYANFLQRHRGVDAEGLRYFQASTMGYFGVGIDATSALDAVALGLPGFAGLPLPDGVDRRMSPSAQLLRRGEDDYVYHFPDGNAGVARALLRALRPDLLPGAGMDDLVDAVVPPERLDEPAAPVRLRQRATVVALRHLGPPASAALVELRYLDASGRLRSVRARQVLLACWHRVIARLTDELPAPQRRALDEQVKTPLVYATALVSGWHAWQRAGIGSIRSPGGFWQEAGLALPARLGGQRPPESPDDPALLHFGRVVVPGDGRPPREQAAAGRRWLMTTGFERFESEIRRLLDAVLAPHGFDAGRDLEAITVNRWAHGYAYEYARPWDRHWPDGPLPHERARRGWGRVAIANSDSGAYAYAHSAIDQAIRAVGELLPAAVLPAVSPRPGPYPGTGA
jgi:spermidine dehydrogenase